MKSQNALRVLIAKPGLDSHDRGTKILAAGLRDAGLEVIYLGVCNNPDMIARTAIDEDVDVLCLSTHTGAPVPKTRRVMELLAEAGVQDMTVLCGGIIPDTDIPSLRQMGVKAVFQPMVPVREVVNYIKDNVKPRNG
ncbi:MAG: cobalamin-dependent protein [Dehalococcoidia bacterium]|nr:cobalamin-dependent protein [Dehalococcoidia bacterium]